MTSQASKPGDRKGIEEAKALEVKSKDLVADAGSDTNQLFDLDNFSTSGTPFSMCGSNR